jgi:hypothetical protein
MAETWLKCSACRNEIGFQSVHWVCSVSTCNRARTRLVFCTVPCWDSHVAMLRHRDAWAVEARSPTKDAWALELAQQEPEPVRPAAKIATPVPAPVRRVVGEAPAPAVTPVVRRVGDAPAPAPAPTAVTFADAEKEILIVVSKLKKYIKDRSGMNCSDSVAEMLSDAVRSICDDAIRAAARDERKTVLDRDVIVARHQKQ